MELYLGFFPSVLVTKSFCCSPGTLQYDRATVHDLMMMYSKKRYMVNPNSLPVCSWQNFVKSCDSHTRSEKLSLEIRKVWRPC